MDFDRALKALLCVGKGTWQLLHPQLMGSGLVAIPTGSTGHGQGRGAMLPALPVLLSPAPCAPAVPETGCQVYPSRPACPEPSPSSPHTPSSTPSPVTSTGGLF